MRQGLTRAFSLIECLVALMILSAGLLGIAGMFTETLRQLHANSNERAIVMLTDELAGLIILARDRIHDHRDIDCDVATVDCFDDPRLQASLTAWFARLRQSVPNAMAIISLQTNAPKLTCTIQVQWQERAGRVGSRSHRAGFELHY